MTVIIALIVGYFVALYAASNILLPVLWAWPKADRLQREGKLERPIPAFRFFAAPISWTVLVLISWWVVANLTSGYASAGYAAGLLAGAAKIGPLVFKPIPSMEEDFAATYGAFIKNSDHAQEEAIARIVANLFEQTAPLTKFRKGNAPNPLAFQRPDSQFRHLMFCVSTVHVVCTDRMQNAERVWKDFIRHLLELIAAHDGADGIDYFGGTVDRQQVDQIGGTVLKQFLTRWSEYLGCTRRDPSNARAGTAVICAMLRETESATPATQADHKRLWPLACWFEDQIPALDAAFVELTKG